MRGPADKSSKNSSFGSKVKGVGTTRVTTLQDAKNINHTLEQLKSAKDQNERLTSELFSCQQELQEKNLRLKVLEDALAFRSEEIGLAGHADLLAKVAQLKGELKVLKEELSDKTTRISVIQEDKSRLSTEHETLQQQIAIIQQRLAQSQQEAYKYSNSDIGILLKNAEKERDVLLEYIQQDMEKSSTFAKQIEKLELDLRAIRKKEQSLEDEIGALHSENERLRENVSHFEQDEKEKYEQHKSLLAKLEQYEHLCGSLQTQLGHKAREEDEIMKHQLSLFAQLRAKDEELMRKTEEIISLRAKVQECDISMPVLKEDNAHMKAQIEELHGGFIQYKKKAIEFESENRALSSTLSRLESENKALHASTHDQFMELQELRPYKMLLDDLDADLQQAHDIDTDVDMDLEVLSPGTPFSQLKEGENRVSFSSPISSTAEANASSVKSTDGNDLISQLVNQARLTPNQKQKNSVFSLDTPKANQKPRANEHVLCSQKHSLWIGLPSIRKVHPLLYDRIRQLAQDLHRKETQYSDLHHLYEKLVAESAVNAKDMEGRLTYLSSCHNSDQEKLISLTGKLHALESEYYALKDAKACLNHIRTVISAVTSHPLLSEVKSDGEDFTDIVIQGKTFSLSHLKNLSISPQELDRIPDTALPNIIQELLSANAQAVLTVKDTLEAYRRLETDNREVSKQSQQLNKVCNEQTVKLQALEVELNAKNQKLVSTEVDVQQQLDIAAELAEKQNALMLSLEAKIESLHREKQLKNAQISAIQQREDALRGRVLSYFEKEKRRVPFTNPTLSDLLQLLLESASSRAPSAEYVTGHFDRIERDRSMDLRSSSYRRNESVKTSTSTIPAYEAPRRFTSQETGGNERSRYGDTSPISSRIFSSADNSVPRRSVSPSFSASSSRRDAYHHESRSSSEVRSSSRSHSRYHHQSVSDEDLISSMADREARSLASRSRSATSEEQRPDLARNEPVRSSNSATQLQGSSSAAQALQERIKKAQQTFRVMRDSSSNIQ